NMTPRPLIEIADHIQAKLIGTPDTIINRVQPFDTAGLGDVSLAADIGYLSRLNESGASAFIVPERLPQGAELIQGLNYLVTSKPKLAFARAIALLHSKARVPSGIDRAAI